MSSTHWWRPQNMVAVVALLVLITPFVAQARDEYLGWWTEEYGADSSSDDAVCQLCHERGGGGNGWNRYGWLVRQLWSVNNNPDLETRLKQSLQDVEAFRIDPNNGGSPTFLEEINANAQPGWQRGMVNTIRFRDDTPSKVISPPPTLPCALILDSTDDERTCSTINPIPTSIAKGRVGARLETVAEGFIAPVAALAAPGEPQFIYVVQQGGQVWRVELATGAKQLFLDFSGKLVANYGNPIAGFAGYDERGLLGFAFHPDYQNNRKIVTYISEPFVADRVHFSTMPEEVDGDHLTVVSEWTVIAPLSSSPQASGERALLIVEQPQFNHNGGMLSFGPNGYLYIALGDGGAANDAGPGHGDNGNAQNNTNPLGAILRINPDDPAPVNGRYGIPDNNPFVGKPGLDEIFVYGLRNPYRFAIEPIASNDFELIIGDVGQNAIEEINRVPSTMSGSNLGWNFKEGSFYFSVIDGLTYVSEVPPDGQTLPEVLDPVAEYDHGEGLSVIGGYVYRGNRLPQLSGKYVFGDWGRSFGSPDGRLFYLENDNALRELALDAPPGIHVTGFGKDAAGELYVVGSPDFAVTSNNGKLLRIAPADSLCWPIKARNQAISVLCL